MEFISSGILGVHKEVKIVGLKAPLRNYFLVASTFVMQVLEPSLYA